MEKKGKLYPQDLFLIEDKDGNVQWYKKDPFRCTGDDNTPFNLEKELIYLAGGASRVNPVMVRIKFFGIHRGEEMTISLQSKIRKGEIDKHLENMEGNLVEILDARTIPDSKYPLNGVVINRYGEPIQLCKFDMGGKCSDGNPLHNLVAINGQYKFEEKPQLAPDAPEEPAPDTTETEKN